MRRFLLLIATVVLFSAIDAKAEICDNNFCMDCVQGFKIDRAGNKTPVAQCCMANANCLCFGIDEVLFVQKDRGWGCQTNTEGLCTSTHDDDNCAESQGDPHT